MADWFKFYENGIYESRFQWAIHEESGVCPVWVWILSECCKHKAGQFGWKGQDFELFGVSHVTNLTAPKVNLSLNLLVQIGYIEVNGAIIKVLNWNKFQSDYMRKQDHRKSVQCPDSVRTKTEKVVLEERRGEENRSNTGEAPSTVVEFWNAQDGIPKVVVFTEKRRKALKVRMEDEFFSQNWQEAIKRLASSAFCTGNNGTGWKADIEWFLKPDSVAKIMEGKYDGKKVEKPIVNGDGSVMSSQSSWGSSK